MRLFKRRSTAPPGPTGPVSADALHWDHVQKSTLPFLHDDDEPTQPRHISGACFSTARPTPLANPFIVVSIPSALALIDLPADEPRTNPNFVDYVSGCALPPGSEPIAHCYAGYQFGTFAGQLGDGAAISLGEVVNKRGERWDVQLKGAGRTHYSRTADGRKVLRSSLRELLASEAMHALGIPTTRAAALAASSSTLVARDIHYNGDVIHEKASVLMRLAPSFLRFGSFEIAKAGGPSPGQHVLVGKLVDHTCKLLGVKGRAAAFGEMVVRTASLAAAWMSVGFCHSVLNTDNMSVLGLTLDYGPFGFMEAYDPSYVSNSSDKSGQYAFAQQPEVLKWNCERLAEALSPVVPMAELRSHLERFDNVYFGAFSARMLAKLGLRSAADGDDELLQALLEVMEATGADWTVTFRALCNIPLPPTSDPEQASHAGGDSATQQQLRPTVDRIVECCATPQQLAAVAMQRSLELGATSAEADVAARSEALRRRAEELGKAAPAAKKAHDIARWGEWLRTYTRRLGKEDLGDAAAWRARMRSTNPRVVLRNWVAQEAIDAVEAGDMEVLERVLHAITHPYDESADEALGMRGPVTEDERYALPSGAVEGRCLS